jgi:FdhD protein
MPERSAQRGFARLSAGGADESRQGAVAVEEPLEIRVAGEPLAVTMRTPGDDHELALGLLLSEGVIAQRDDVGRVFHCGRPGDPDAHNVLDVLPGPGVALAPERVQGARRGSLTTSACGVCGRQSIDDLLARCGPVPPGPQLPLTLLLGSVDVLRANQRHFAETGGLHAAAVLAQDGSLLVVREDVGRHNAVDKAIGHLLLAGCVPVGAGAGAAGTRPALLVVSGRVSFEIVQKAAVARIGAIAAISAPTTLAIDLAQRCGIALAGFVRDRTLNLYCGHERIDPG